MFCKIIGHPVQSNSHNEDCITWLFCLSLVFVEPPMIRDICDILNAPGFYKPIGNFIHDTEWGDSVFKRWPISSGSLPNMGFIINSLIRCLGRYSAPASWEYGSRD